MVRSLATGPTHHVDVQIDNMDFQNAIAMREMAVYAQIVTPDEGDPALDDPDVIAFLTPTFYGYSYCTSGYESIAAGSEFHRIWTIGVDTQISRSSSVTIVYDGSGVYATFDSLEPVQEMVQEAYDVVQDMRENQFEGTPVTTTQNGLMTPDLLVKLNGIQPGATNYVHPSTHPASMIVTDSERRFVTDDWLAQVNAIMEGSNGATLASLAEDISYIMWQLVLNGIIDADGVGNVIVDNIDSEDAVHIISGIYANSRVYI
ncbi:hypothetical protein LJC32_05220 [Oscillospiraceae bacterium OttesenSCG-928-F05]|nr:hypothetical protein [Oscillospiraceae bacterium OttesenSCG-928-F05]